MSLPSKNNKPAPKPTGAPYRNITSGEVVHVLDVVGGYVDYIRTTPLYSFGMKNIGRNETVRIEIGEPMFEFQKPEYAFLQCYRPLSPFSNGKG